MINRRGFIGRLFAGAALSLASNYAPAALKKLEVTKPNTVIFTVTGITESDRICLVDRDTDEVIEARVAVGSEEAFEVVYDSNLEVTVVDFCKTYKQFITGDLSLSGLK